MLDFPALTADLGSQESDLHHSTAGSHWVGAVSAVRWEGHHYWVKWFHYQVQCGGMCGGVMGCNSWGWGCYMWGSGGMGVWQLINGVVAVGRMGMWWLMVGGGWHLEGDGCQLEHYLTWSKEPGPPCCPVRRKCAHLALVGLIHTLLSSLLQGVGCGWRFHGEHSSPPLWSSTSPQVQLQHNGHLLQGMVHPCTYVHGLLKSERPTSKCGIRYMYAEAWGLGLYPL